VKGKKGREYQTDGCTRDEKNIKIRNGGSDSGSNCEKGNNEDHLTQVRGDGGKIHRSQIGVCGVIPPDGKRGNEDIITVEC